MADENDTAVFPQTPKVTSVDVVAADDLTTAGTNTLKIAEAGLLGAEFIGLSAVPRATLAADNRLDLFRRPGDAGDFFFVKSVLMPSHVVAATTAIVPTDFGYTKDAPLEMEAGDALYVGAATAFASGIVFTGETLDLAAAP